MDSMAIGILWSFCYEVPPPCSIESEQSVSLDDKELRKFLEEQKKN